MAPIIIYFVRGIGDSARFDRAKTIDLCQNPLTVRSFLTMTVHYPIPFTLLHRKNQNWREHDRFPNGLRTTMKLPSSRAALQTRVNYDPEQSLGPSMLWLASERRSLRVRLRNRQPLRQMRRQQRHSG